MEHRKLPSLLSGLCAGLCAAILGTTATAAQATAPQQALQIDWSFQDQGVVGSVSTVSFSPNGRFVAYGYEFSREIFVRNAATGSLITTLSGSSGMGMTSLAFSPRGIDLAAAYNILGWSGAVVGGVDFFQAGSTAPALSAFTNPDFVTSLAWSPLGTQLLTGAFDGTAVVLDPVTGVQLTIVNHGAPIMSVAFSPDGLTFATGGDDGVVNLWETSTGLLIRSIGAHLSLVSELEFHPDNTHLATGGGEALIDSTIKIWDYHTGAFVNDHTIQQEGVTGLEWVAGGSLLMSSDLSGIIRISQVFTPLEVATIDLGRGPRVSSLDYHAASKRYTYGSSMGWITMAHH
jgi:WD40 repeat protein